MKPRWRKVLHDLFDNKGRTLLVVFSIAVGVFSIGVAQKPQRLLRPRPEGERFIAPSLRAVDPERFTAGQRRGYGREKKATSSRQRDSSRDLAGLPGIVITNTLGELDGGKHPG